MSTGDHEVYVRRRNIITVLEADEEEVECNHVNAELNTIRDPAKKDVDVHGKSIYVFCAQEDEHIREATKFRLYFRKIIGTQNLTSLTEIFSGYTVSRLE